jgi:hypothetical protein
MPNPGQNWPPVKTPMAYRGAWVTTPTPEYQPGEVVSYAGKLWVAPPSGVSSLAPDVVPAASVVVSMNGYTPTAQTYTGPFTVTGSQYSIVRFVDINPGGSLTISATGSGVEIGVMNQAGTMISQNNTANRTLTGLAAGRYFIGSYNWSGAITVTASAGAVINPLPNPWDKIADLGAWLYDQDVSGVGYVDIPSLDGNTDLEYEIILDGVVAVGGAARNITIRPNNLTTNTYNSYSYMTRGAAPANGVYDSGGLMVGYTATSDMTIDSRGTLFAKSGRARRYRGKFDATTAAQAQTLVEATGKWDDSSTNITSLRIDFGGATFTGRVRVRKI